ncbi:MAG: formyl transferase domain protein [Burkholderiales bacterium]|jgi:folate-dependent phosphoribosylglycinamide formyltransferase PurN|nr:formyl transferase domain protein [Burkholderiales bacterium]
MINKKIVMLVDNSQISAIIYNALKYNFIIERVICENSLPRFDLLKSRYNKLGFWKVFGQMLFQLFVQRVLKISSKARISTIIKHNNLDITVIDQSIIERVSSINSEAVKRILQDIAPSVVVVNGTRIINEDILYCVNNTIFVNIHMGITPKYRGVHGAYWALVNKDKQNCGVTVHLVDKGIDTGSIIFQDIITCERSDNFVTYPFLQVAAAIPLLCNAISNIFDGTLTKRHGQGISSNLWYHPTILQYMYYRFKYGIK